MKKQLFALLFTTALAHASAGQTTEFTRVLLPISTETVSGANGSLWSSELWAHSNSEIGATVLPLTESEFGPLKKNMSVPLPVYEAPAGRPPGQIILVSTNAIHDVELNLRIRDLSRQAETWGTSIPVVREEQFRTRPVALLPVPLGSGFRTMVRLYGLEQTGGAVRVRVSTIQDAPATPLRVLYEQTIQLPATASVFAPPYAELLLNTFVSESTAQARVDVEPVTPGLKFWAFASVTHNDTQHVTVVAPN